MILARKTQRNQQLSEFEKDIWDGRVLGADIRAGNAYTIDFLSIAQPWLPRGQTFYSLYV